MTLFQSTCRSVIPKLMKEFGWRDYQAAGCMGNIGHESGGLERLRETGGGSGYGWAQWTGPRANVFLSYCKANKLNWRDDAANYSFLIHDLHKSYGHTVASVAKSTTLVGATSAFERTYEIAGIVNMRSRVQWAKIALAASRKK